MFSKFIDYILFIEQEVKHDVEAIIADFTDTVSKLEAAAEAKAVEAEKHMLAAISFENASAAAYAASDKAKAVASRIKDLVS